MITAVDTSVLIDILAGDRRYGEASRAALADAHRRGATIACEIVWAEVTAGFGSAAAANKALDDLRVEFRPLDRSAARAAGHAWRRYRAAGGRRTRIVGDFLIGAHATAHADRLLTRDRGFYRTYFRGVRVTTPELRP